MRNRAYDDAGQGFPVVLIHGHPFNRSMWAPQLAFLCSEYRVIIPALRGYGDNLYEAEKTPFSVFAKDILELVDSLAIDRFVLGGLSMEARLSWSVIGNFPNGSQDLYWPTRLRNSILLNANNCGWIPRIG